MHKYELVLLIDHTLKKEDRESMVDGFEKTISESIIKKDDIGLLQLKYDLTGNKGHDTAYFVSYYVDLNEEIITGIKKELQFNKQVLRYRIFKMAETVPFFEFKDLQKKMEDEIESRWKQRIGQKITYFSDDRNKDYLVWKSVPMLKKYVTRFWNIKPRKYTWNAVLRQKKLRKCILRARELWVLEYVR